MENQFLKKCKNGLLLTPEQIALLKRYEIPFESVGSMSELMLLIDNCINDLDEDEIDELNDLLNNLNERYYYENVNK